MAPSVTVDILVHDAQWLTAVPEYQQSIETICNAVLAAVSFYGDAEISVVLADDTFIRSLNHEYRGKDSPTNVLSFPSEEFTAGDYEFCSGHFIALGDIILSLDTLQREAEDQHKPLSDHFTHLLIHGTLHLLGFDHENEEEATIMEHKETEILYQFGIKSPYLDTEPNSNQDTEEPFWPV